MKLNNTILYIDNPCGPFIPVGNWYGCMSYAIRLQYWYYMVLYAEYEFAGIVVPQGKYQLNFTVTSTNSPIIESVTHQQLQSVRFSNPFSGIRL